MVTRDPKSWFCVCGRNRILCFSRCTLVDRVKSCISLACALEGLPSGRQVLTGLDFVFVVVSRRILWFVSDCLAEDDDDENDDETMTMTRMSILMMMMMMMTMTVTRTMF